MGYSAPRTAGAFTRTNRYGIVRATVTTFASRGRLFGLGLAVAAFAAILFVLFGPAIGAQSSAQFSPLGAAVAWGPDAKSPLFYSSVHPPFGDGKTAYVLRFRPHSRFRFGVGILNEGHSPLRIEGIVPTRTDTQSMLHITGLQMQHRPNTMALAGATSEPLTIPPGGLGYVIPVLDTRGRCGASFSAGGSEELDSIRLDYSYRGDRKTESYSLPVVVGIVCGSPKLLLDSVVSGP